MSDKDKIKRCGMCGTIMKNGVTISIEEIEQMSPKEIDDLELDWCDNCGYAEYVSNQESRVQVTRDMAIDAGDPDMEGQWINW